MIKFEDYKMPAGAMGEMNPLPDIKNVSYIHAGYQMTDKISEDEKTYLGKGMISTMLPYMMQDNYDRDKKERNFKAAILENDYIKAVFLPEIGGRLWSLYDKKLGKELLYVNPVFQPCNLALRNAWFSGGVEFNVGIKGHNPLTCSPMWCAVDKTDDGDILRLYEFERIRGVVYSINAYLPDNSPVLYIKCKIENTTNEQKHMYWWSNIAVPEEEGTRVIVPTDDSFLSFYDQNAYLLDKATIPVHEGVDVSYPLNLSSSRDFFYKIPEKNNKWIVSVQKDGAGLLQCSDQKLKGRKLFVWGMGQGGRHWGEWLSVEGSSYIEIQAGLAHTQLEHIPMPGKTTWEWTEGYTAMVGDPAVMHGDYKGAIDTVESYLANRVGDLENMPFPTKINSSEIIYKGSDWGAIEEAVRGERVSSLCSFPKISDDESAQWWQLIENNSFPCPDVNETPKSYVKGSFWAEKLLSLPEQSWYSLLHLGVICYEMGDLEKAKKYWEESIEKTPSAWAMRNLAMLYKNELGNAEKGMEFILRANELKGDCRSILAEVGAVLTSCNEDEKWLGIYGKLSNELKAIGRLRLLCAVAYINLDKLEKAAEIINPDFVMNDIKEGELSVSHIWFELYRRLYAKEEGVAYDADNKALIEAADKKYPLPKKLDFRMHD